MSDETKFTPGPWIYCEQTDCVVATNVPDDGGDVICAGPDLEASIARWPQNRDLIAAAPELYAELDRLRAYIASPLCLSDHAREADRRKVLIAGAETALSRARTAEVE